MLTITEIAVTLEWLRTTLGIFIELVPDGYNKECVTEDICYRVFIWEMNKPKPHHNDDLGAFNTPRLAYDYAIDYILGVGRFKDYDCPIILDDYPDDWMYK